MTYRTLSLYPAVLSLLPAAIAGAQPAIPDPKDWSDPEAVVEHYLSAVDVEPIEIVLLGTFHFNDQGLDEYKPQHHFDPLEPERQEQIKDVVAALAAFAPTKVCVERVPSRQESIDEAYAAYREDELRDHPNEIVQIGFRLADRVGLDGVECVDAQGRWYEPRVDVEAYAREHGQEDELTSPFMPAMASFAPARDRFIDRSHLRDVYLFANSEPVLLASHGVYLTGGFGVGQGDAYPGVDGYRTQWYNRNLRIFQNIRRVTEPGDRVVLLMGAGHIPILRHCVESSFEFRLVEVNDVLGEGVR